MLHTETQPRHNSATLLLLSKILVLVETIENKGGVGVGRKKKQTNKKAKLKGL